ncbi:MAG TPA: hypothetical protein VGH81_07190 [Rudaea sp.]
MHVLLPDNDTGVVSFVWQGRGMARRVDHLPECDLVTKRNAGSDDVLATV